MDDGEGSVAAGIQRGSYGDGFERGVIHRGRGQHKGLDCCCAGKEKFGNTMELQGASGAVRKDGQAAMQ